jgi:hypothetical protein
MGSAVSIAAGLAGQTHMVCANPEAKRVPRALDGRPCLPVRGLAGGCRYVVCEGATARQTPAGWHRDSGEAGKQRVRGSMTLLQDFPKQKRDGTLQTAPRLRLTTNCHQVEHVGDPAAADLTSYLAKFRPGSLGSVFRKRNRKPLSPFMVTVPSIFWPSSSRVSTRFSPCCV